MSRYCGMCRELHDERGPWCRNCQHAYGHGRERGRDEERAAVVAWLRMVSDPDEWVADRIERGEHIPKEPKR